MKKYLVGLIGLVWGLSHPPAGIAINRTWIGSTSNFNAASNWSPAGLLTDNNNDDLAFNTAAPTAISVLSETGINSLTFNPGASAFTLTVPTSVILYVKNAGILNNSGQTQTIVYNGRLDIYGSATITGDVVFSGNGLLNFYGSVTPGNVTINNSGGTVQINNDAGNATINNNAGTLDFTGASSGGNATILNHTGSTILMQNNASLGNAALTNDGTLFATALTVPSWTVGSISGSGDFQLGSSHLTVGSNAMSTTFTGTMTGIGGSLTKVGNGTLTWDGSNNYTGGTTVNAGTLNLLSSLSGGVTVGPAGNLSGTGTLGSLVNTGTVTPGVSGSGTLTASSYSGPGTLSIPFNGSSYATLKVTGNANVSGGALSVTGLNAPVGEYRVINAGSLSGSFATLDHSGSPLITVTPRYTATDLWLTIQFATPFSAFAQNTNQRNLATNLEGFKMTSTADFTSAISLAAQLPASQMAGAYDQISGDSLVPFQAAALQNAAVFIDGMLQRAVNVSSGSYGAWGQGIGWANQMKGDGALGSPAAQALTGGLQAGYDWLTEDPFSFGFSGGYADTSLDVSDRTSSGQIHWLQSGIYARYHRGPWSVNGAAAYTSGDNGVTRAIHFGTIHEQATAHFDSRLYTTAVQAGYTFDMPKGTIEPSLSIRQSHLIQDRFTESGAPGLNLTVADRSIDSWDSSLGLTFHRFFFQKTPHALGVKLGMSWDHELASPEDSLSVHFAETSGGSDFTVQGTPRDRETAALGLETQLTLRPGLELWTHYTAMRGATETFQKIAGGLQWTW
jgi:autotransporter-associated beta strand protein